MTIKLSNRCSIVSQSEIRAMTRECIKAGGINMSQGVCDLDVPFNVIEGAKQAMDKGRNTYTPCDGLSELKQAVAAKAGRCYGMNVDAETEVVICIGATGAFYATCLSVLNRGDEVIMFEPYYGYHAATLKALDAVPVYVRLEPPDWKFSREMLDSVTTERTRAMIINTPANPSGKVFSEEELQLIAAYARDNDLVVFTDEIYEHFVFDNRAHIPPAMVEDLRQRTITISGFSKVFSITGWRVGYAICPEEIALTASQFNDLVYVCAPAPLQLGAAKGLEKLDSSYYQQISDEHEQKRNQFCGVLQKIGLTPYIPQGAYYVLADISAVPGKDDKERVMYILKTAGVAAVPGRAFYDDDSGRDLARFCFAKKPDELDEACRRLSILQI